MDTIKKIILDLWPTVAIVGGLLVFVAGVIIGKLLCDCQAEARGREGEEPIVNGYKPIPVSEVRIGDEVRTLATGDKWSEICTDWDLESVRKHPENWLARRKVS